MGTKQIPKNMKGKKKSSTQRSSYRQYKYDTYEKFADTAALNKLRAPAGSQRVMDEIT